MAHAGGSARASPQTDEDGFTVVPSRHRKAGGAQREAVREQEDADTDAIDAQTSGSAQPASATVDTGGASPEQRATDDQADGGQPANAEDEEPTAEQLKESYDREQQVADMLARQGLAEDHPARVAADAQATEAKLRWQRAKPGVAVTLRMVWAEKALVRARRNQARMEQSIDDLDCEYESERARRLQELQALRTKTHEREAKLAEVSRQAAREFRPADDLGGGSQLQGAAEAIDQQVAPVIRDLLGQLPTDSPMRGRIEGVLTLLTDVSGTVGRASQLGSADEYYIADDEEEAKYWSDHAGDGDLGEQGNWPVHTGAGNQQPQACEGWYHDGWGWRRALGWQGGGGDPCGDGAMDTSDAQVPTWMSQRPSAVTDASAAAAAPLGRACKRWKVDGADPHGFQGRQADDGEDGNGNRDHENAARLQAAVSDASNAAAAAASAAAGVVGAGTDGVPQPPTPNMHDMALEQRKQQIWDQAQDEGVPVSMETIAGMVAEELEEWAAAHLERI